MWFFAGARTISGAEVPCPRLPHSPWLEFPGRWLSGKDTFAPYLWGRGPISELDVLSVEQNRLELVLKLFQSFLESLKTFLKKGFQRGVGLAPHTPVAPTLWGRGPISGLDVLSVEQNPFDFSQ